MCWGVRGKGCTREVGKARERRLVEGSGKGCVGV